MQAIDALDFKDFTGKLNSSWTDFAVSELQVHRFSQNIKSDQAIDETDEIISKRVERTSPSHSLITWGCGEFGQHGLCDYNGDVTLLEAIHKYLTGKFMIPDEETPIWTVCGSSHTLLLTDRGNLYSWGNGSSGQLGDGTRKTRMKPVVLQLQLDSDISGMSCGARHSFIWTSNGCCYSFGNNFNAQLGYNYSRHDFKENQLEPVLVELSPKRKIRKVACGARHSMFLLTTGQVMAVGCNQHGQIGNNTVEDVVIPTVLEDLYSVTDIAAGNIHSLASDENGDVFAWGYGKAIGDRVGCVITPQKMPTELKEISSVISLAAGDCHSMVLYKCGTVYTWGNNYEGQLGLGKDVKYQSVPTAIPIGSLPRTVVQIECGEVTSAALTAEGELYMWGKNAGLIHADKRSQYFQYLPHHVMMENLSVSQVSLGAWHISCLVRNARKDMRKINEYVITRKKDYPVDYNDINTPQLVTQQEPDLPEKEEQSMEGNLKEDRSPDECFLDETHSTQCTTVIINSKQFHTKVLENNFINSKTCNTQLTTLQDKCSTLDCPKTASNDSLDTQNETCSEEKQLNDEKLSTEQDRELNRKDVETTVKDVTIINTNEVKMLKLEDVPVICCDKTQVECNRTVWEDGKITSNCKFEHEQTSRADKQKSQSLPAKKGNDKGESCCSNEDSRMTRTRIAEDSIPLVGEEDPCENSHSSMHKGINPSFNTIAPMTLLLHSTKNLLQDRGRSFSVTKDITEEPFNPSLVNDITHIRANRGKRITSSLNMDSEQPLVSTSRYELSSTRDINLRKFIYSRQQPTMPIVDLHFHDRNDHSQSLRIRSDFIPLKHVWKVSTLLKDDHKKWKDHSSLHPSRINLECMLPKRRLGSTNKRETWKTRHREGSEGLDRRNIHSQNQRTRHESKQSHYCHNRGEILPPICSCKKYQEARRR